MPKIMSTHAKQHGTPPYASPHAGTSSVESEDNPGQIADASAMADVCASILLCIQAIQLATTNLLHIHPAISEMNMVNSLAEKLTKLCTKVAVMGAQSAGKSTLLARLLGIPQSLIPASSGTTTKFPLHISSDPNNPEEHQYFRGDYDGILQPCTKAELIEFMQNSKEEDFNINIRARVNFHSDRSMSLIDIPGFVAEGHEACEKISKIYEKHIPVSDMVLFTINSATDVETDSVWMKLRTEEALKSKVIFVFTYIDKVNPPDVPGGETTLSRWLRAANDTNLSVTNDVFLLANALNSGDEVATINEKIEQCCLRDIAKELGANLFVGIEAVRLAYDRSVTKKMQKNAREMADTLSEICGYLCNLPRHLLGVDKVSDPAEDMHYTMLLSTQKILRDQFEAFTADGGEETKSKIRQNFSADKICFKPPPSETLEEHAKILLKENDRRDIFAYMERRTDACRRLFSSPTLCPNFPDTAVSAFKIAQQQMKKIVGEYFNPSLCSLPLPGRKFAEGITETLYFAIDKFVNNSAETVLGQIQNAIKSGEFFPDDRIVKVIYSAAEQSEQTQTRDQHGRYSMSEKDIAKFVAAFVHRAWQEMYVDFIHRQIRDQFVSDLFAAVLYQAKQLLESPTKEMIDTSSEEYQITVDSLKKIQDNTDKLVELFPLIWT